MSRDDLKPIYDRATGWTFPAANVDVCIADGCTQPAAHLYCDEHAPDTTRPDDPYRAYFAALPDCPCGWSGHIADGRARGNRCPSCGSPL